MGIGVRATARLWVGVAAAAMMVAGCGGAPPAADAPSGSPWTSGGPGTVSPSARSAADDLAGFFSAVEVTDRDLRAAADAVNAGIGADTVTFTRSTIDAIGRAEPSAVAEAIPAGLPPVVERAVLLVYSDLVSRYASLSGGSCVYEGTRPRSELDPRCFTQGHTAAVRMSGDVAAARSAAESAPPVVAPAPDTRAAVEVRIREALIDVANRGCDSAGGYLATELIAVRWSAEPSALPDTPEMEPLSGEVVVEGGAGTGFWADYSPGSGWTVRLNAC